MNLVNGELLDLCECDKIVNELGERVLLTLAKGFLKTEKVIEACGKMADWLNAEEHLPILLSLGIRLEMAESYLRQAKTMFGKEYLLARTVAEFGGGFGKTREYIPPFQSEKVKEQILPLGVLLHIAAGNMDGLPSFTVIEGLLTGNINILKLPEGDGGLSVQILKQLIRFEPALAEYIYVFEVSSKDIESMSKLIEAADAVAVWGGDGAVSALRRLVPPNVKLIEWGHKLSFCYITKEGISEENMIGLANNICTTNQLLCSSCQGVFVDTECREEVYDFCERFLPVLQQVCRKYPDKLPLSVQAQITQQLLAESLEVPYLKSRIFKGEDCCVIAYPESELQPSIQFRNLWVSPLPKAKILPSLKKHKTRLQTASLLCGEGEAEELCELLFKAGVVHIAKSGEKMSSVYCGAPHDGEYPLRRYTKTVYIE